MTFTAAGYLDARWAAGLQTLKALHLQFPSPDLHERFREVSLVHYVSSLSEPEVIPSIAFACSARWQLKLQCACSRAQIGSLSRWCASLFITLVCCIHFALSGSGDVVNAAAAISFVQVASATPQTNSAAVSVRYPAAQTSGDLNVVVVGWNDTTATVRSVKDSAGNNYRLAIGPTSGKALRQSIYYAANIASGSNTVTVTFSQAASYPDVRILEYRGVTALGVTAGASGSSASASSGSATTRSANELVFGANMVATRTTGAGSGFTSRAITSPDGDIAEDKIMTTAGSNNATATLTSAGPWVMQMTTFSAVSPAPPAPTLSGLTCSSASMTGAGSDSCTVTLSAAAPSGGVSVSLASSNAVVRVPARVTIPANATSVRFTANVSSVTSAQAVTLTASAGVSKSFALQLNATAPTLSGVSPSSGSTSGGTAVTITGTNFASRATVKFGSAAATNVVVVNSTKITATTPAGSVGVVTPTVTNPGLQSGSLANGFIYSVPAAISFVQVASATPQTNSAAVSVRYPAAQTSGDLNVVVVGWNDTTATVQSVKDSAGNNYRLAIGPTSGKALRQSIYYAANIASGSNTVTVTFSQAASYPDVRILEYRGVTTLDVTAGASGSSASASSGSATTRSANELVFGANMVATRTTGAGSGFTSRAITSPDGDIAEDKIMTTAGSNNATATLTSAGPWVMQMATFSAVSPAPPAPTLSGLTCSSASMTGAGSDSCTVTLSAAAPSGGVSVSLASSNAVVRVPARVTIPANATSVRFTANVSSVTSAQAVTLTASAGVSKSFALQLNATAPTLSISATNVAFGNVGVKMAATRTMTLSSTGTAAVTVSAATVTGTGFTVSGATFPVNLNPGQSVTLNAQFGPIAKGAATGQLTIKSNSSSNGTVVISLSGTGTPPEVALSWDAPSSSPVPIEGYKIYRSTGSSSTYQPLNSSIDTETTYVDSTVQSGTAYIYYVESVDSSGRQSAPSNKVSVTIP